MKSSTKEKLLLEAIVRPKYPLPCCFSLCLCYDQPVARNRFVVLPVKPFLRLTMFKSKSALTINQSLETVSLFFRWNHFCDWQCSDRKVLYGVREQPIFYKWVCGRTQGHIVHCYSFGFHLQYHRKTLGISLKINSFLLLERESSGWKNKWRICFSGKLSNYMENTQ